MQPCTVYMYVASALPQRLVYRAGTVIVAANQEMLHIHQLVMGPQLLDLQHVASVHATVSNRQGKAGSYMRPTWAPDGSCVLLELELPDAELCASPSGAEDCTDQDDQVWHAVHMQLPRAELPCPWFAAVPVFPNSMPAAMFRRSSPKLVCCMRLSFWHSHSNFRAQPKPVVQELYMLDLEGPSLTLVDGQPSIISKVAFSPCSMFFVVARQPVDTDQDEGQSFKVFSRGCVCLASFYDEAAFSWPSVAFISGERVAITHLGDFDVRHLPSGNLLGSAGPDEDVCGMFMRGGLIAANPSGSQLAFCTATCVMDPSSETGAVHVFDAISSQPLASYCPVAQLRRMPEYAQSVDLVWSAYGWLLAQQGRYLGELGHLQFWAPLSGTGMYKQHVWTDQQPLQGPVLSPCGAFCCLYDPAKGGITVVDIRSQQTVLTHALAELEESHQHSGTRHAVNIWWSKCGRRLIIRALAVDMLVPGKFTHQRMHVLVL